MSGTGRRYPRYGIAGLVALLLMQGALFCVGFHIRKDFPWWWITANATPVCWWGYILAIDAWLYQRNGSSLLTTRRNLLTLQCILSVVFWCLFEAYNRVMPGWRYINLPDDLSIRLLGYAVAFATIMPGMFLTCELLQTYNVCAGARMPPIRWSSTVLTVSVIIGALFSIVPPLCPVPWRGYLWAFVWTGWFFMLEPFNYRRGLPSIYRDWERGDLSRTLRLFLTGALCGLLWEFWNVWAFTKWEYTFLPHGHQAWKYFEMPWVGFLGFLPFALEYFVMFHFIASFFTSEDKLGI
jgi:hypothetical protein